MVEAEAVKVRKLILGVALFVLPFAALTVGGSSIAGASSVGTGTVSCDIGGTVTFGTPLSTESASKRDAARITVNASESTCSSGVVISKGSGRFILRDTSNSPCFRYGGGWGASLSLTLHYSHLKSSVYKGGIGGVQAGGEASSLSGQGSVTGSYLSAAVAGTFPSGATFNGIMNDAACFGAGITTTSFSLYFANF
jgi:hypothetical protein